MGESPGLIAAYRTARADRLIGPYLAFQFLGHERMRIIRRGAGAAVAACQDLEQVPVGILEVDAAAVVPPVDLAALSTDRDRPNTAELRALIRAKISSNSASLTRNA